MRFNGMHIQENSILTDTVLIRMCRSKRKRIVKKWLKNKRNYKTVPSKKVLVFGDPIRGKVLVCHPVAAEKIREALRIRDRMLHNTVDNQPSIIGYPDQKIEDVPTILQDKYQLSHNYKNFS